MKLFNRYKEFETENDYLDEVLKPYYLLINCIYAIVVIVFGLLIWSMV